MAGNLAVVSRRPTCPSTRMSLLEDVREADNAEAWQEFVDTYSPLVYGYCRGQRLQEADARDVTQNVFLAVSRAMRSFEYDRQRGRFRSWLGTITCREIRRYLSRSNPSPRGAGELAGVPANRDRDLESEWETQFTSYLFHQAMQQVRPTFAADVWRAFELTWLEDQAPAEVARQLERPIPWIYKAKFRVLSRLREKVEMLADDIPRRPK